ncbi:28716_t:CDS:2, partial [Gigaspora margarita]
DIVEIWELFELVREYKYYIILLIDGSYLLAKFNINLIAKQWYIETFQNQDNQLQEESIGVLTQFQQVNNTKHIGFGKMKKALNIVLDFNCIDEFISMIKTFIAYKKNSIKEISQKNINMDIADPIVCKHHERPATKRIKSSSETDLHYSRTNNSALNLLDSNLYKELT